MPGRINTDQLITQVTRLVGVKESVKAVLAAQKEREIEAVRVALEADAAFDQADVEKVINLINSGASEIEKVNDELAEAIVTNPAPGEIPPVDPIP